MEKHGQQEAKKTVVRYESNPKGRETLLEIYDIKTPLGRGMLVMDAVSLSAIQRAVLHVLAIRSGGPKCDHDPELSCMNNRAVAGGAGISLSKLYEVWVELSTKKLIYRSHTPDNKRTYTRVYWSRLISDSYRWQDMLLREAGIAVETQMDDEQLEEVQPANIADEDRDDPLLDHPTGVEERIDPKLAEYLTNMIRNTTEYGFDAEAVADVPCFDLDEARKFCEGFQVEINGIWLEVKKPLHEAAAIRLNRHAGLNVNPEQLHFLNKLKIDDPFATLDHAFSSEPWSSTLKKSKSAGLLVSLFEQIDNHYKNQLPKDDVSLVSSYDDFDL